MVCGKAKYKTLIELADLLNSAKNRLVGMQGHLKVIENFVKKKEADYLNICTEKLSLQKTCKRASEANKDKSVFSLNVVPNEGASSVELFNSGHNDTVDSKADCPNCVLEHAHTVAIDAKKDKNIINLKVEPNDGDKRKVHNIRSLLIAATKSAAPTDKNKFEDLVNTSTAVADTSDSAKEMVDSKPPDSVKDTSDSAMEESENQASTSSNSKADKSKTANSKADKSKYLIDRALLMVCRFLKKPKEKVPILFAQCSFSDLITDNDILPAIAAFNYTSPTRVQEALLPALMRNPAIDIWATTSPGSGVTLAYTIAMLSRIDTTKKYTQALCITPSYEAALQIAGFMRRLSVFKNVRVGLAVRCEKACVIEKDYHIIVGTHKEIVSFHLLQVFKVQLLNMVVFDDADMTASTTLIKDQIIKKLPATCQKVFLSAYGMVSSPMNNIVEMKLLINGSLFPVHIDNYYVECRTSWKFDIIKALSADANKVAKNGKIMVFFTQKDTAHSIWTKLIDQGEDASLVCSALSFDDRQKQLTKFRNSTCRMLLTTDVSARGLDVPDTKVVVNYDLPHSADMMHPNPKLFLSRITRAGRMSEGLALSLLDEQEQALFKQLTTYYAFTPKLF